MRKFAATTSRRRDGSPVGSITIRFPRYGWFLMAVMFLMARLGQDEYPRTSRDGTKTTLVTDHRGRVSAMVFEERLYTRRVTVVR